MNALLTAILFTSMPVSAGYAEDCSDGAHAWFEHLAASGCPTLDTYKTAAIEGCRTSPDEGWTRAQKAARKAILNDCQPSTKGFPGAEATLPDGTTSGRCSEMLRIVQGVETAVPAETVWGIDRMMASISTALFACHAPNEIDLCLLPSSIQTPAGQIDQRKEACESLHSPPLDTFMKELAWTSGLMPVIPAVRIKELEALLVAQKEEREQRAREDERFHAERAAEVERARQLSEQCMVLPGDMNSPEETVIAADACRELEALWRGEDTVRKELESSGALADRYAKQLQGKVLNAESLNAADPKRVASRPAVLDERRVALVGAEFDELIQHDPEAAEKLMEKHRTLMGPDWTAEALDQLLATGS